MTKRRLLCWSLLLVTLAAFAVWLEPTRVVWGWLRGDAFYDGRPTRWWRGQLPTVHIREVWENHPLPGGNGEPVVFIRHILEYREPEGMVPWFAAKVLRMKPHDPAQLWEPFRFAADAEDVIAELQTDQDATVRAKAEHFAHDRQIRKGLPPIPDEPVP